MNPKLLASAATLEGIEKAVREYWASDAYSVDPESLLILHPSKDMNAFARIVRARGRFRFERGGQAKVPTSAAEE